MRFYTPLRYPGGKARLGQYMRQIFVDNALLDGLYVEPYAGGAGIAMELLLTGYAREIWLNDIDPAIYAFWQAVLHHTEDIIDLIKTKPLTITEWRRQRTIYHNPTKHGILKLGFATLFLNRTNRSGILNAGVIGGFAQEGKWLIDARFNREELSERIRRIGAYSHRIHVSNEDTSIFLQQLQLPPKSLVYLDPPYFHKGQRLYRNHYQPEDHEQIAKMVQSELPYRWIVSYDNTPEISKLYTGRRQVSYILHYSAQTRRQGGELMIFCDSLRLPKVSNPVKFNVK